MHAFLHYLFAQHVRDPSLWQRLASPLKVLLVIASQAFWAVLLWRQLASRARWPVRLIIASAVAVWYATGFAVTFGVGTSPYSAVTLTPAQAIFGAPFQIWLFGSVIGFVLIGPYRLARFIARLRHPRARAAAAAPVRPVQSPLAQVSPSRREFLRLAGGAAAAAPFVVGAYGVVAGRLELETTHPVIPLARLPPSLHGFRIAQLSDIHIGPFMSEQDIRRVAGQINALRPDLIVLTGDFVIWDPSTQTAAVAALSGLKAPFGIYGCLGNHELYTDTERSITRLFRQTGVTMLRQAAATISVPALGGLGAPAQLQLLGVDYIPRGRRSWESYVRASVPGVGDYVRPDLVNILLAHNPNCFERAAQLGLDLTISGHTHGGQIALLSPELSPARLITRFVAGHYRQGMSQLYVNRGLGTIALPMRICAPPEVTLFELASDRSAALAPGKTESSAKSKPHTGSLLAERETHAH